MKALEGAAFDPFKAYNFRVMLSPDFSTSGVLGAVGAGALASVALGSFTSVAGIGWKTEVRTVREGGVNDREHKLPGQTTCNELLFTKGLTLLDPMWEWYRFTLTGRVKRMNGTIVLMSDIHTPNIGAVPAVGVPVAAWNFYHAWPTALEGARLDASQSLIAVQQLTLAVDRIEKTISLGSLL